MSDRFDQRMAARVDALLTDDYLAGIDELDVARLRAMRVECEHEERRVSYGRRILQGRIDVLRAEAASRDDAGRGALERLTDVLADSSRQQPAFDPATTRPPQSLSPDDLGDDVEVEGPVDVAVLDDDALAALADRYAEQERVLSDLRRRLFDVIDRLQEQVAERYRSGTASVSELLTGD